MLIYICLLLAVLALLQNVESFTITAIRSTFLTHNNLNLHRYQPQLKVTNTPASEEPTIITASHSVTLSLPQKLRIHSTLLSHVHPAYSRNLGKIDIHVNKIANPKNKNQNHEDLTYGEIYECTFKAASHSWVNAKESGPVVFVSCEGSDIDKLISTNIDNFKRKLKEIRGVGVMKGRGGHAHAIDDEIHDITDVISNDEVEVLLEDEYLSKEKYPVDDDDNDDNDIVVM